jgi:hypothetical protein
MVIGFLGTLLLGGCISMTGKARFGLIQLFEDLIGVLHVGFVKVPMLVDLLVGNTRQCLGLQMLLRDVSHTALASRRRRVHRGR